MARFCCRSFFRVFFSRQFTPGFSVVQDKKTHLTVSLFRVTGFYTCINIQMFAFFFLNLEVYYL